MDTTFANFTNNTSENVYAGSAEKEIHTLNEEQAKRYDTNRQATDALDIMFNNLPVEERNNPIKMAAIQQHKAEIADLVSRGDYQNASLLVQKMAKDFKMDNQLQGALQSQQLKSQHEQEVLDKSRGYSEEIERNSDGSVKKVERKEIPKGERYNEEQVKYIQDQDKLNNVKPITYNPETRQVEGKFKGTTLVGDKAGEIYDNANKRIENWKEGSIVNVNGEQITKTKSSPTGYFNVTTGKEVRADEVFNALKTEIENRPEYMDYINQKTQIDYFNNFQKKNKDITKSDLNDIGLSDDKLKTIKSGYTQEDINKLQAKVDSAKKLNKGINEAQTDLDKAIKSRNSVNPNNFTQDDLNKYWAYAHKEKQLNNFVVPATAKAEFSEFDNKYLSDTFGLESLKHFYTLAEQKAANTTPIIAPPDNPTQIQQLPVAKIEANNKDLATTNATISNLTNELNNPNTSPTRRKEATQELNVQQARLGILQKNNSNIETSMQNKGYDVDKHYRDYLLGGFNNEEDLPKDPEAQHDLLNLIDKVLAVPNAVSTNLKLDLMKFKGEIQGVHPFTGQPYSDGRPKRRGWESTSVDAEQALKALSTFPIAKKIYDDFKNDLATKANSVDNTTSAYQPQGMFSSGRTILTMKNDIDNSKIDFLNTEKVASISTNLLSLDEDNSDKTKMNKDGVLDNPNFNKQQRDFIKSQVTSPASNFLTENGETLYSIASNQSDIYKLANVGSEKGGTKTIADPSESQTHIATFPINGVFPVSVSLRANSQPLQFASGGNATVLVYPQNPEVTSHAIEQIGDNYIKNGADSKTKMQGVKYKANVQYLTQLQTQVAPETWSNEVIGYSKPVTVTAPDSNGEMQEKTFEFKKTSTGKGTDFTVLSTTGNPLNLTDIDGRTRNNFKSLEDFSTVLYLNTNHSELEPYNIFPAKK